MNWNPDNTSSTVGAPITYEPPIHEPNPDDDTPPLSTNHA